MALSNKNEDIPFVTTRQSLNNNENVMSPGDERSSYDPQSYGYRGRIGRQVTLKVQRAKDNKSYKVIVPYNFDEKRYIINKKEIEFYENKRYFLQTLTRFNETDSFQIEKDYTPKPLETICIYLPIILICMIFIYLGILSAAFFSFNIVIIVVFAKWIKKGYDSLLMFKFILFEKFKIKEIHKILKEENDSDFCVTNKLKWILGQSGYWLEVHKLVE